MNIVHEHVAAVADKVALAGSAGTLLGWATSSNFGMWAGILIGFCGLVVNWYFKRKSDHRSQEAHVAFLKKLEAGGPPPNQTVFERLEADE